MKNLMATLILILLITGCGNNENSDYIEESGTIEANDILLSAKSGGEIIKINFDEGSLVNKGDTLLIIDPYKYQLLKDQALSAQMAASAKLDLMKNGARAEDLELAKQNLKLAEVTLTKTNKDKLRFERLVKEGSATQKNYEDVKIQYDIASAKYESAKANLKKMKSVFRIEEIKQAEANLLNANAMLALAEKNYSDCFVIAPQNGMVVNSYLNVGETAMPSSALMKLSDLSELEIVIYVSELDLGKVKTGQKAEVKIDSFTDKTYEGKIIHISPEAEFTPKNIQTKDERTKLVFAVKVKVDNPEHELKSGLPADVKILL